MQSPFPIGPLPFKQEFPKGEWMSPPVHLLVDYENVQPTANELLQLRDSDVRLWIFHGPHQTRFPADVVSAWQPLGDRLQYVKSDKAGRNALDLHIAFCMGELAEKGRASQDSGRFVVIAKDKDLDALFGYLRQHGIHAARAESLSQALTCAENLPRGIHRKAPEKTNLSHEGARILAQLRAHPQQRPATEKRLLNFIASFLALDAASKAVARVIAELKESGVLAVQGTRLTYRLPAGTASRKEAA